jgi:hypothetical protein
LFPRATRLTCPRQDEMWPRACRDLFCHQSSVDDPFCGFICTTSVAPTFARRQFARGNVRRLSPIQAGLVVSCTATVARPGTGEPTVQHA